MISIVSFLVLAFLLFFLEIIVPGGFLAIAGGIAIIVASVFTYKDYGMIPGSLVFMVSTVFGIILMFLEVKFLTKTKFANQIQSNSSVEGSSLVAVDIAPFEGKIGEAIVPLSPTGRIRIDGQVLDARSEEGWVEQGGKVRIIGSDVFHVQVREVTEV